MLNVVIIDDEHIVLEGMRRGVNWAGMGARVVDVYTDGISGLRGISSHMPDLAFVDIRMPGDNGLQLISKAQMLSPYTLFAVFSGYREFEYAQKAIDLDVIAYIEKPITPKEIEATVLKARRILPHRNNSTKKEAAQSEMSAAKMPENTQNGIACRLRAGNIAGAADLAMEWWGQSKPLFVSLSEGMEAAGEIINIFKTEAAKAQAADGASIRDRCDISSGKFESIQDIEIWLDIMTRKTADCQFEPESRIGGRKAVQQVMDYIHNHYMQDISLSDMAALASINATYLSKLFKDITGVGLVRYITAVRIEKAIELLARNYKVAQVSQMVGFSNYRYFCDVFKKHMDVTPSEYRELCGR